MEKKEQKHNQASVGWFKLSELIDRGEKEKSLVLYRLLSHSFDDRAYALQVEGDILWAFDDESAQEKYAQAAYLYQHDKKSLAAFSVYRHLFSLSSENISALQELCKLSSELSLHDDFSLYCKKLMECMHMKKIERSVCEEMLRGIAQKCDVCAGIIKNNQVLGLK